MYPGFSLKQEYKHFFSLDYNIKKYIGLSFLRTFNQMHNVVHQLLGFDLQKSFVMLK